MRKRAPGLCDTCALRHDCPIEDWPADQPAARGEPDPRLTVDDDPDATGGPRAPIAHREPEVVWLTAESLGDADPALAGHTDLPVVFTFDEPLLRRLRLSGKRLVFLVEALAEIAQGRDLAVHLGDPVAVLGGRPTAVTFAPVPGFRRRVAAVEPAVLHPWPWLRRPHGGSVRSFSAWRKGLR